LAPSKRLYGIQHNDTHHEDIQHNKKLIATFSMTTLCKMALVPEYFNAVCHLCWIPFLLSVTDMPFMVCVIMLNVVGLSVIMLNVVAPSKQLQPQMKHFGSKFWLHTCVSSKPFAIKLFNSGIDTSAS